MKNRVGIFGGSFNPVHTGHVKVAESFLNSSIIEELLILLTPTPPHKDSGGMALYHHRLEMLNIAFQKHDRVTISDLEKSLPSPSYTLQTIRYLQDKYPSTTFYLCIGEDSIQNFHKWYKYGKILELVPLLVAERPGYDASGIDEKILERAIFVDHRPVDISSTEIRNGEKEIADGEQIPPDVHDYINKHNLY